MLKRNKAISIVLAFVFCMTFLAPALVAPATAEASSTYSVLKAPSVTPAKVTTENPYGNDLGVVKVTLDDTALYAYSKVTVSLPSDFSFPGSGDPEKVKVATTAGNGITIVVGDGTGDLLTADAFDAAQEFVINSDNTFDIEMTNEFVAADKGADQYFYIYFNGVDLKNTTGDIEVEFYAPSGSGFSSTTGLIIGKSSTSGSTTTTIKKVKDITENGPIDSITIMEDSAGSLTFGKTITLEILTRGFEWKEAGQATYGWSLSGTANTDLSLDTDKQKITLGLPTIANNSTTEAAKVVIDGMKITVDDEKADPGDEVEVKVSGADMDKAYVIVAKYVDYEVTVEEGTTKTLVAGQKEQKLGEFYIKEGAAGSLLGQRTVKLTLPSGVEWSKDSSENPIWDKEIVNSSDIDFTAVITGDNNETLKLTVSEDGSKDAKEGAEVKFKDCKVNVSPDFTGDIELEVSGSAGAEGTINVAEVVPAATISVDKVNDIILGKPDQKIADITITEGAVEGLLEGAIKLELDEGYRFVGTPTVEVVEGDIDIDEDDVDSTKNTLTITVEDQSDKTASEILISDIYVDAFRTAPEGPVEIEFVAGADNALNQCANYEEDSAGSAVVANCVTAALGETIGNGQFVITSNIYEVNGVKKVMDAAPYIKNDRTYVPVRYLAYVLGLTDDDIVWDAASQKVTLTKGDTVVELTIGSTTMYVNGEAVTMDVAPEITSDRTMLPARYVAEGFGYQVGWDALTRTVLISK